MISLQVNDWMVGCIVDSDVALPEYADNIRIIQRLTIGTLQRLLRGYRIHLPSFAADPRTRSARNTYHPELQRELQPIQWDVDSLDWKDYDADTICQRVTSKSTTGQHRAVPQRRPPHAGGCPLSSPTSSTTATPSSPSPSSSSTRPTPSTTPVDSFQRRNCLKNAEIGLFFTKPSQKRVRCSHALFL